MIGVRLEPGGRIVNGESPMIRVLNVSAAQSQVGVAHPNHEATQRAALRFGARVFGNSSPQRLMRYSGGGLRLALVSVVAGLSPPLVGVLADGGLMDPVIEALNVILR